MLMASAGVAVGFVSGAVMFVPLVVRAFYIGIIFKRSCRQAGRGFIRASLYAAVKLYAGLGKGRLGSAAYSAAYKSFRSQ